jgi:adenosylcobinamide hydrolase
LTEGLVRDGVLAVDFGGERRTLSSAVLGGGLTIARTWLNVTVAPDYSRNDPSDDLAARARQLRLAAPVVGMLTSIDVADYQEHRRGAARVFATVGVRHGLAAAGTRLRCREYPGTINFLVLVDERLDDAALAGAVQTAVEAKAQALAAVPVLAINYAGPATGTATDAYCIAALRGGGVPFAGPATLVGSDIAHAVFDAVFAGACAFRASNAPRRARARTRPTEEGNDISVEGSG